MKVSVHTFPHPFSSSPCAKQFGHCLVFPSSSSMEGPSIGDAKLGYWMKEENKKAQRKSHSLENPKQWGKTSWESFVLEGSWESFVLEGRPWKKEELLIQGVTEAEWSRWGETWLWRGRDIPQERTEDFNSSAIYVTWKVHNLLELLFEWEHFEFQVLRGLIHMGCGFCRVTALGNIACLPSSPLCLVFYLFPKRQKYLTQKHKHVWLYFLSQGSGALSVNITLFPDFRVIGLWEVRGQRLVVTSRILLWLFQGDRHLCDSLNLLVIHLLNIYWLIIME